MTKAKDVSAKTRKELKKLEEMGPEGYIESKFGAKAYGITALVLLAIGFVVGKLL